MKRKVNVENDADKIMSRNVPNKVQTYLKAILGIWYWKRTMEIFRYYNGRFL